MELVNRIYDAIFADELVLGFSRVIAVWLIGAVTVVMFRLKIALFNNDIFVKFVSITPTSLASLGILGTFTGILVGLLDFDVTDVEASVPNLLEGLKVSFLTSIVGISAAIGFRLFSTFVPTIKSDQEVTEENILKELKEIRDSIELGFEQLGFDFRNFSDTLIKNNQEALVKALNNIVKEFNHNLTEQFGENFKKLNDAVYKLVEWQENYKDQITSSVEALKEAQKGIEGARNAIEEISRQFQQIQLTISKLKPVLEDIKAENDKLKSQLEAISSLREQVKEAFPAINKYLDQITSGLATRVDDAMDKLSDESTKIFTAHRKEMDDAVNSTKQSMEKSAKNLDEQFRNFDSQMQQELTKAFTLLAQNLTSLSEKFVDDYTPLVDELRKIVELPRKVNRDV